MTEHSLKCETEYYQAVEKDLKLFEVRKNDRNFQPADIIFLSEVVKGIKTGREEGPFYVDYILYGGVFGIDKDYCVMQLNRANKF